MSYLERILHFQDNPGFPHLDSIAAWCQEYGLNEDMMLRIFGYMYGENHFLPPALKEYLSQ